MDNLEVWEEFSQQMKQHIAYEQEKGLGLLFVTGERICQWNILKYATRIWNSRKEDRDYFKIAHYAQVAWTKQMEGLKNG